MMKEIRNFVDAISFNQTGSAFQRNIDIIMTFLYGEIYQPIGNSMGLKNNGKRVGDVSDFIVELDQQKIYGGIYLQQPSQNSTQKEMEEKFIKKMRSDIRKVLDYKKEVENLSPMNIFMFVVKSFPKTPSDDSRPSRTLLDKIENTERQYQVKIVIRTVEQLYIQILMNYREFTPQIIQNLELPPSYKTSYSPAVLDKKVISELNGWINNPDINKHDWLVHSIMSYHKPGKSLLLVKYFVDGNEFKINKESIFYINMKSLKTLITLIFSEDKEQIIRKIQTKLHKNKNEDNLFQQIYFIAAFYFLKNNMGEHFIKLLNGKTKDELNILKLDLVFYYIPKMINVSTDQYNPHFLLNKNDISNAPQLEVF